MTLSQMAATGTAASADLRVHSGPDSSSPPQDESYINKSRAPQSLREALRSANGGGASTPTDSTSEEDYDDESNKPVAVLVRRRKETEPGRPAFVPRSSSNLKVAAMSSGPATPSDVSSEAGNLDDVAALKGARLYTVASDDKELRDILKKGMQRVSERRTGIRGGPA